MYATLKNEKVLFPELSYKIAGCAFDVFRQLGHGHIEKVYQKSLAKSFEMAGLKFIEQAPHEVKYNGEIAGKGFFDFLVEDKIVVELKRGKFNVDKEIHQTLGYLKMSKLQLGIIIRFEKEGARFRRILNIAEKEIL
jgi:GxxExxY protein